MADGQIDRFERYIQNGYPNVVGWMGREILWLLGVLNRFHASKNIKGGFCEIGVHHGKLFFAMANICQPQEFGLAIDLFHEQELNIDRSGSGDRQIFERGLVEYCPESNNIEIIAGDSTDPIKMRQVLELGQRFRFFSIDGGHTFQHFMSDIVIADQTIVNGGFILVDDYCSPGFPGVTEGLICYLNGGGRLVPVCAAGGKMILASISFASAARDFIMAELIAARRWRFRREPSSICGHPYIYFKRPKPVAVPPTIDAGS